MYTDFFGLKDKPFNMTPDSKFIYLGKGHKECSSQILSSIQGNVGLIVLTGKLGAGKTTICRSVLNHLPENYNVIQLFDPHLEGMEFLKRINKELGINYHFGTKNGLQEELNNHLIERNNAGRRVVMVVEGAQNLSPDAAEQIMALSGVVGGNGRLIQIILVGQPELDYMLESASLRQLRQMIAVWCRLAPLSYFETTEYVIYRMSVVGGEHLDIFSNKVMNEIFKYSKGVPRLINLICDRALQAACAEGERKLDVKTIRGCIRAVNGRGAGTFMIPRFAPAFVVVAFMAVLWMSISSGAFESSLVTEARALATIMKSNNAAPKVPQAALAAQAVPAAPSTDLFFSDNGKDSALNVVFGKWGIAEDVGKNEASNTIQEIADKRDMKCFEGRIDTEMLRTLNYPAILVLDDGLGKKGYLPVIGFSGDKFVTGRAVASVGQDWALKHWKGEAYVLWKDFSGAPEFLKKGDRGKTVKWLQASMEKLGYLDGARNVTGIYGKRTEKAVLSFQEENKLTPDGRAGEITRMLILGLLREHKIPRLS
jgi:general secretion pathway protein A